MIQVKGTFGNAVIYTDNPQEAAIIQIENLMNQPFMKDTKVRIMPDYHAGKGCVIGTTIQLNGRVVPNLVGVDVGCGVYVAQIDASEIDFAKLDQTIRRFVPSGNDIHEEVNSARNTEAFKNELFHTTGLKDEYTNRSLGTLGGGNHFIEVAKDHNETYYLLIHTGSRYVGAKVANWHQKRAFESLQRVGLKEKIEALKNSGQHSEIQTMIQQFKNMHPIVPKDLAYLEGEMFQEYIDDMKRAQAFAKLNRETIAQTIANHMNWHYLESFDSIHNYIDTDSMILRKGAVRAKAGEKLVIPMNMRDGSFICIGKGNAEWNESAPHGAGRLYSRTAAMKNLSMNEFKDTMREIWTTSVTEDTLDEAPMAYKPMAEIESQIGEAVTIEKRIMPVYNFKASETKPKWAKKSSRRE